MQTSKLPIEVCERVIDFLCPPSAIYSDFHQSKNTLYASALVCKHWLPRAQLRLFHHIQLRTSQQALAFIRIVVASPMIARFVLSLKISPLKFTPSSPQLQLKPNSPHRNSSVVGGKQPLAPPCYYNWIYKACYVLPPILTNLSTLALAALPTMHTAFFALISRFKAIRVLYLSCLSNYSFGDIIRLVNRFPRIQRLHLEFCEWARPVRFHPTKQVRLGKLFIRLPDYPDYLKDVLSWLTSSRCASGLSSLHIGSVHHLLNRDFLHILYWNTRTLRSLSISFREFEDRSLSKSLTQLLSLVDGKVLNSLS